MKEDNVDFIDSTICDKKELKTSDGRNFISHEVLGGEDCCSTITDHLAIGSNADTAALQSSSAMVVALPHQSNRNEASSFLKEIENSYFVVPSMEEDLSVSVAIEEDDFELSNMMDVDKSNKWARDLRNFKYNLGKNLLDYNKVKIKDLLEYQTGTNGRSMIEKLDKLLHAVGQVCNTVRDTLANKIARRHDTLREQLNKSVLKINNFCGTAEPIVCQQEAILEHLKIQGEYTAFQDRAEEIHELEQGLFGKEVPVKRPANVSSAIHKMATEAKIVNSEVMAYAIENGINTKDISVKDKIENIIGSLNIDQRDLEHELQHKEFEEPYEINSLFEEPEEFAGNVQELETNIQILQNKKQKLSTMLAKKQCDLIKFKSIRDKIHNIEEQLKKLKQEHHNHGVAINYTELEKSKDWVVKCRNKIEKLQSFMPSLQALKHQLDDADIIKKQTSYFQQLSLLQNSYPKEIISKQIQQLMDIVTQAKADLTIQLGSEERQSSIDTINIVACLCKEHIKQAQEAYTAQKAIKENSSLSIADLENTKYASVDFQFQEVVSLKRNLEMLEKEIKKYNEQIIMLEAEEKQEGSIKKINEQREQRIALQEQKLIDQKNIFEQALKTKYTESEQQLADVSKSYNETMVKFQSGSLNLQSQTGLRKKLEQEYESMSKHSKEIFIKLTTLNDFKQKLASSSELKKYYLGQEAKDQEQLKIQNEHLSNLLTEITDLSVDLNNTNKIILEEKLKAKNVIEKLMININQLLADKAVQLSELNKVIVELETKVIELDGAEELNDECQQKLENYSQQLEEAKLKELTLLEDQKVLQGEIDDGKKMLQAANLAKDELKLDHDTKRQLYAEQVKNEKLLETLNDYKRKFVKQRLDLECWSIAIASKMEEISIHIKDSFVYKKKNSLDIQESLKRKIKYTQEVIAEKYSKKIVEIEDNLEWLKKKSKQKKSLANADNYLAIQKSWNRKITTIEEDTSEELRRKTDQFEEQLKWLAEKPNAFSVASNVVDQFTDKQDLKAVFNSSLVKFQEKNLLELPLPINMEQFSIFLTMLSSSKLISLKNWISSILNLCTINIEAAAKNLSERRLFFDDFVTLNHEVNSQIQEEQKILDADFDALEKLKTNLELLRGCRSVCDLICSIRKDTAEILAGELTVDFNQQLLQQFHVKVKCFEQECQSSYLSKEALQTALKVYTFKILDEQTDHDGSNIAKTLAARKQLQSLQRQCQQMIIDRQLLLYKQENLLLKFTELDLEECEKYLPEINGCSDLLKKDLNVLRLLLKEISRNLGFCHQQLGMYLRGEPLLYLAREMAARLYDNKQPLDLVEYKNFKRRLDKLEQFTKEDLSKSRKFSVALSAKLKIKEAQEEHGYLEQNIGRLTQVLDLIKDLSTKLEVGKIKFAEHNSEAMRSEDIPSVSTRIPAELLYYNSKKEYEKKFPHADLQRLVAENKSSAQKDSEELRNLFQNDMENYRTMYEKEIAKQANLLLSDLETQCRTYQAAFSQRSMLYKEETEKRGLYLFKKSAQAAKDASFAKLVNVAIEKQEIHGCKSKSCRNLLQ